MTDKECARRCLGGVGSLRQEVYDMPITKIVSGAQTGADRGGLDAAIYCDLPYGGWCPKGRKAEDGSIPDRYQGLSETKSADYRARTEANVVDSDATLVLTYGPPTGGSTLTVKLAKKHKRSCLKVDLDEPRDQVVQHITEWLNDLPQKDVVLNVAGSRESKSPGIQHAVMVRMIDVISKVNGKLFYPLQDEGLSGWIIREDAVGTVVRLSELVDGVEPGYFILLDRDDKIITLCMVGEDENGDICTTDRIVRIPARHASGLHPTTMRVEVPPESAGSVGDD